MVREAESRIELFAVGVALSLVLFWWANPDAFIADDSYFYLEIARNLVREGSLTFSGVYPTNGFHPLWLALLSGYTWLIQLLNPAWLESARYALPLSGAVLVGGAFLLSRFARRARLSGAVVVVPVVCFLASFGVLYSEAHLTFACLAALLLVVSNTERTGYVEAVAVAGASAALFLARLDMAFVVATIYLWYLFSSRRSVYPVTSALLCALLLAPYLTVNYTVFGGLTPISGFLKSTFPTPNLEGFAFGGGLVVSLLRINILFGVIPLLLAGCAHVAGERPLIRIDGPQGEWLLPAVAAGVGFQLLYTGLFTWGHTNWYWYYVPAIVVGTWSVGRLERTWEVSTRIRITVCILLLAMFGVFSATRLDDGWPTLTAQTIDFIQESVPDSAAVFVSERPGRTAFYTDAAIVAADMLTANRRLYREMVSSGNALVYLEKYCQRRGKPLEYIVYSGGRFVTHRQGRIIYYDPRMTTLRRRPIGTMKVGSSLYRTPDGVAAWRLISRN